MRGNALMMINNSIYIDLIIKLFKLLNDEEARVYLQIISKIVPADENDEFGGNIVSVKTETEINVCDKMAAIGIAFKINDDTYKINPNYLCSVHAYDENKELTAALAIDYWKEMR